MMTGFEVTSYRDLAEPGHPFATGKVRWRLVVWRENSIVDVKDFASKKSLETYRAKVHASVPALP